MASKSQLCPYEVENRLVIVLLHIFCVCGAGGGRGFNDNNNNYLIFTIKFMKYLIRIFYIYAQKMVLTYVLFRSLYKTVLYVLLYHSVK